jgi:hypothetical protein
MQSVVTTPLIMHHQHAATHMHSVCVHTAHVMLQGGKNAQNQSSQSLVVLAHHRTRKGLFFCQPVTAHRMGGKE